jgi:hypothetical protein
VDDAKDDVERIDELEFLSRVATQLPQLAFRREEREMLPPLLDQLH